MFELTRRRGRVILLVFAVLALGLGGLGSGLFEKVQGGGYTDPGSESTRAAAILRDTFGQAAPNLVLLVETGSSVDDDAVAAAATTLTRDLAAEPGVTGVVSYWTGGEQPALRSADGSKGLVVASLPGDETAVDARVGELVARYGGDRGPLEVTVGGYAMLLHETVEQSEKDVVLGESLAFPVTLIALLFVFGGLVAASLPLLVAAVTVMMTVGALTALTAVTDLAATATNVATLLGLGLAIDYSLLVVSRFRDELDAGRDPAAAVAATMRTAGRTVVFSAITVAVALSGLLFFPLLAVRSMGCAGLVVAALAALVSLTVLPALLLLLGARIDRGRFRARRPAGGAAGDGFWHRLATQVMRRPLPIGLAVAALLIVLGLPFLGITLGFPDERALPESMSSRQVSETLAAEFALTDQHGLFAVLPESAAGVDEYARALAALPDVRRVDTVTGSYLGDPEAVDGSYAGGDPAPESGDRYAGFRAGDAVYLSIVPATADPAALDRLVDEVRAVPAPSPVLVGGVAAGNADALAAVTAALPIALAFVVLVMLVVLFLLTGSIVLPVVAIALSALSLTATFGALVWIFQEGHLSGLLGFTVTGDTPPTVPVMLFAVAFGLAMDYQVFLLSRIREEYRRTGDNETAVALGLERIGRIVTAAAVLISLVLLGFLVSDITFMKAFGIGLPLAVLVDATLVRGFLLPAAMKLLGDRSWYAPRWMRALHDRFGLDDGSAEPPRPAPARWLIDEQPAASGFTVPAAAPAFRGPEGGERRRGAGKREPVAASVRAASPAGAEPASARREVSSAGDDAMTARADAPPASVRSASTRRRAASTSDESVSARADVPPAGGAPASIRSGVTPSADEPATARAEKSAAAADAIETSADGAKAAASEPADSAPEPSDAVAKLDGDGTATPGATDSAAPDVSATKPETAAAPAAAAAADPAPAEAVMADPAPAETVTADPAPAEAVMADPAPAETVTADPAPAETVTAPDAELPAEPPAPPGAAEERDAAGPSASAPSADESSATGETPAATGSPAAAAAPAPAKKTARKSAAGTRARKTAAADAPVAAAPTRARKTASRAATSADAEAATDATGQPPTPAKATPRAPAKKATARKTPARKAATATPAAESVPPEAATAGSTEVEAPAPKRAPRKAAAKSAAGDSGVAAPAERAPRKAAAKAPAEGSGADAPAERAPRKAAAKKAAAPEDGATTGAETAPAKRAPRKAAAKTAAPATPRPRRRTSTAADAATEQDPSDAPPAKRAPRKTAAKKTAPPPPDAPAPETP